ncbi:hypothetical protein M5K25_022743 [Dendrobium thyrsiflorum]|uniref:Uncharacterized protein n=1 Tax=Dendrobium thyrsiflorum TaxID=117978 RepID=A0ABD0U6S3_DENTH
MECAEPSSINSTMEDEFALVMEPKNSFSLSISDKKNVPVFIQSGLKRCADWLKREGDKNKKWGRGKRKRSIGEAMAMFVVKDE